MTDWQPIKSAPTCECQILTWDGFAVNKTYWYGKHGVTSELLSPRPWISHWMPLPSPPTTMGASTGEAM